MNYIEVDKKRKQMVAKKNELIRDFRISDIPYTIIEQKTLAYMISMVKPTDTNDTEYTFDIKTYCEVAGLKWTDDTDYTQIKRVKKAWSGLASKNWWLKANQEGDEKLAFWFRDVSINNRKKQIKFKFHENVFAYIFELTNKKGYTQYELENILQMRSQYSIRLYELLQTYFHAYQDEMRVNFDLEEFKEIMNVSHLRTYNSYGKLKEKIIDKSLEEINIFTRTMRVDFKEYKSGRGGKVQDIEFIIRRLNDDEKAKMHNNYEIWFPNPEKEKKIKRKSRDKSNGQINMF